MLHSGLPGSEYLRHESWYVIYSRRIGGLVLVLWPAGLRRETGVHFWLGSDFWKRLYLGVSHKPKSWTMEPVDNILDFKCLLLFN